MTPDQVYLLLVAAAIVVAFLVDGWHDTIYKDMK